MSFKQTLKALEVNFKRAWPDIALATGIVLNGIAVFKFCEKTYDAVPVVKQLADKIDASGWNDIRTSDTASQDEKHAAALEVASVAKDAAIDLAKIYWKPVLLWSMSTGLVVNSHVQLKNQNMALATLATGLATELRTLHGRIIDRYGETVDRELKHGITYETVEEKRIDEATGSEVVDTKQIAVVSGEDRQASSIYSRYFDESSAYWKNDPETNLYLLKMKEKDANLLLRQRGVLFLNEVYDMLDIPRTKAGQKVGWRYYANPEDNKYGDNKVSFGITNIARRGNRDFVNGYQSNVLLDFNVDGSIIDALPLR